MSRVDEAQKQFISRLYLSGKKVSDIITEFEAEYGYSPSTRVINKWKYYNETQPPTDKEPEPEKQKQKQAGKLAIQTKDTRTVQDDIDFSSGEIEDQAFDELCRKMGKSRQEMWNILSQAHKRGYRKVNISTGELSK